MSNSPASLTGDILIATSAEFARSAHEGQEHFFGEGSYFDMHVDHVAQIVRRLGYGATYIAGAYLHDVLEDTGLGVEDLQNARIPENVITAVDLVSKKPGQPHEEYLRGIVGNGIAVVIKFADSSFNFAWTILNSPKISDADFGSWSLEYADNIRVLRPLLPKVA